MEGSRERFDTGAYHGSGIAIGKADRSLIAGLMHDLDDKYCSNLAQAWDNRSIYPRVTGNMLRSLTLFTLW